MPGSPATPSAISTRPCGYTRPPRSRAFSLSPKATGSIRPRRKQSWNVCTASCASSTCRFARFRQWPGAFSRRRTTSKARGDSLRTSPAAGTRTPPARNGSSSGGAKNEVEAELARRDSRDADGTVAGPVELDQEDSLPLAKQRAALLEGDEAGDSDRLGEEVGRGIAFTVIEAHAGDPGREGPLDVVRHVLVPVFPDRNSGGGVGKGNEKSAEFDFEPGSGLGDLIGDVVTLDLLLRVDVEFDGVTHNKKRLARKFIPHPLSWACAPTSRPKRSARR